jgi:8-oxo-dGTP pyrophosphatase MutT (NUDIX family)
VLLYEAAGEATLLLTERSLSLPHHPGQISLPGGLIEPGEAVEEAAGRETLEEAGVDPRPLQVLGRLSTLHIPVSGFLLHPVVAWTAQRPEFRAHAPEVSRLVEVPWAELASPGAVRAESRLLRGEERKVPYFAVAGVKVWGATAMVLSELLWVAGTPVRSGGPGPPEP